MPVPENQLDTWAKQGGTTQSRNTYAVVKNALEDRAAPYSGQDFTTYLQGSYSNDTNVYRDSDVDVVIQLNSTFYHDAYLLEASQFSEFQKSFANATYSYAQFKLDVAAWLKTKFGDTVRPGKKAIFIPAGGGRRDCDVLPAAQYRYYYRFKGMHDQNYAEGICFWLPDGTQIVNFPKQHCDNCTAKHQATNQWFKPTVRILKNMRNYLVDLNQLQDGLAPSYFIEGLLHNVSNDKFGKSYDDTFVEAFNYLIQTDRSNFKCANGIHSLLADNSHVSWPPVNCQTYLDALRVLWNNWR